MSAKILEGNSLETLKTLPAESVQCVVTSPPYYGLRDYGAEGQIGLESTPEAYVENLVAVFRECRRVLKSDGVLWVVIGDSYAGGGNYPPGYKPKDLMGIPWMVAFALRADGWFLRQDIIWSKPNPMPESVIDRCTKAHEYIFLLSKSNQYYFDNESIKEYAKTGGEIRKPYQVDKARMDAGYDGHRTRVGLSKFSGTLPEYKNKRSVWEVPSYPYKEAHFATFPPDLIEPCILAGSREGDTVLDPFNGSGTSGEVSIKNHRHYVGCELNPAYVELTNRRLSQVQPVLMAKARLTPREPDKGDSPLQSALFNPEADTAKGALS